MKRIRQTFHGLSSHALYGTWAQMITRCENKNAFSYKIYGGVGVSVCKRWRNSFKLFLEDMGEKPSPNHTLDRYPNQSGNYEPSNCRWATRVQQNMNRKSNVLLKINNKTKTFTEWCKFYGISFYLAYSRYNANWDIKKVFSKKTFTYSKRRNGLDKEKVIEVFNSKLSLRDTCRKYNVSPETISGIRSGKSYSKITGKIYGIK